MNKLYQDQNWLTEQYWDFNRLTTKEYYNQRKEIIDGVNMEEQG